MGREGGEIGLKGGGGGEGEKGGMGGVLIIFSIQKLSWQNLEPSHFLLCC